MLTSSDPLFRPSSSASCRQRRLDCLSYNLTARSPCRAILSCARARPSCSLEWIDERRNQVGSAATSCVNLPFSFADDFTVPFTFLPALSSALLTPPHCGRTDTTRASSTFSPGGWLRRRRRRRRARDPATTIGAGRITFTTRASERGRESLDPSVNCHIYCVE